MVDTPSSCNKPLLLSIVVRGICLLTTNRPPTPATMVAMLTVIAIAATIATTIAVIVQEAVPGSEAVAELIGWFTPIVMFAGPWILGFVTKYTSSDNAKAGLAVVFSVAVVAASLFIIDTPAEINLSVIVTRLIASWPLLEFSYRLWNAVLQPITGRKLNEVALPTFGVQLGESDEMAEARRRMIEQTRGY